LRCVGITPFAKAGRAGRIRQGRRIDGGIDRHERQISVDRDRCGRGEWRRLIAETTSMAVPDSSMASRARADSAAVVPSIRAAASRS
jgi:hypothetical protein